MRDIVRDARKRLNRLGREAAEQFDSTILHNRVWDALAEDEDLRHLLDVTERAYDLEYDRGMSDDVRSTAFGAAEDLNKHVDDVVDAAIGVECQAVIEDARGDWFDEDDHNDEEAVQDAFDEACAWLCEHPDACERGGIDYDELVWGDGSEPEEVRADV